MCKCKKLLEPFVEHCRAVNPPREVNVVKFSLVTIAAGSGLVESQTGKPLVSYVTGAMILDVGGGFLTTAGVTDKAVAREFMFGKHVFSDRFGQILNPSGGFPLGVFAFDPTRHDSITVQIEIETGRCTINAQTPIDLRCANGILYAPGIMISLQKATMERPPS